MGKSLNMDGKKLMVLVMVTTIIVICLLVAINQNRTQQTISSERKSALEGLEVAIRHVNEKVLYDPDGVVLGRSQQIIDTIPVTLLNGKLRANSQSLENGLAIAYKALQTEHSAFDNWIIIELPTNNDNARKVKLKHHVTPTDCHLIYTEAGTEDKAAAPIYQTVNAGC
ncbi:MAG: hypothetical protein ACPGUD_13695 [Parashewanella sp.]